MSAHQFKKIVSFLKRRPAPSGVRPAVSSRAAGVPQANARDASFDGGSAFDPQTIAKLGRLDLIASTVVDGFLSGKHRSTHKGGCTDFAEFRPYARGDDIRQLDWRHYARTDRHYVKRYDDETNLQALLVVDASGSMGFGLSTVAKWQYAQMAAASLGHLLLRQRDSVGLAVVADRLMDFVRPQPRPTHLARLIDLLTHSQPDGQSALHDVVPTLAGRLKRRGMVILFSDCFGDPAALGRALEQFRYHGHDVIVFQILAPEELAFPFRREAIFQDLETQRCMQVNPNTLRKAYLEELRAFMDRLQQAMTDCGVDLMTVSTGDDLGEVLGYHLRRRAAQKSIRRPAARA